MKVIDCINMFNVLGRLRLSTIGDKTVRDALLDDHFALWRVSRDYDDYMESLRGSEGAEEARKRYLWKEAGIELVKVGRDTVAGAASESGLTLADMTVLGHIFKED